MFLSNKQTLNRLNKMKKQVCVIGLGYIGLSTACILANSDRYNVLGVDTDDALVAELQSAQLTTSEPKLKELFLKSVCSGFLKISTVVTQADIYVIAVPTLPDLSYVYGVIDSLKPYLRAGNIIIIESAFLLARPDIIERNLQNSCNNIYVAYCLQRASPGNILHELVYNDWIICGIDEASTSKAVAFYKTFIKGEVLATKDIMTEAVKLTKSGFNDDKKLETI